MPKKLKVIPVPHSWGGPFWPEHVYPGSAAKGRSLIRSRRDELVACGAVIRIGRFDVVRGEQFIAWLGSKAAPKQQEEIETA